MNSKNRRILIGVGLIVLAIGAGFGGALASWRWHEWTLIRDHGKSAPATVTKSDVEMSGRYAADVIYFEFQVEGEAKPRSGVVRLTRGRIGNVNMADLYRHFSKGTLTVRHQSDRPENFCLELLLDEQIAGARIEAIIYWTAFSILGVSGLAILGWALIRKNTRRARRA